MQRVWQSFLLAYILANMCRGGSSLDTGSSQSLTNLFFLSRTASKDPTVTMACFADYMVKSNHVSEVYSASYNQCLMDAKTGREGIEKETAPDRANMESTAKNVCRRLKICNSLNSTLEVFNCHAEIGTNNTKAVYSISGNASDLSSVMQKKYRIIDLKHEQCSKSTERRYVAQTAVIYRALQDCLDGRFAPAIAAPITTTAATSSTPATTPRPTILGTTTTSAAPSSTITPLPSITPKQTTRTTTPIPSTTIQTVTTTTPVLPTATLETITATSISSNTTTIPTTATATPSTTTNSAITPLTITKRPTRTAIAVSLASSTESSTSTPTSVEKSAIPSEFDPMQLATQILDIFN